MLGRRQDDSARRGGQTLFAAAAALILGGVSLGFAGSASAASPIPSYTAGTDDATYTVNGVVDSNCTLSIGGTDVWIKPGDKINFDSALAGVNVGLLNNLPLIGSLLSPITHLTTSQVAGMDVTAKISKGTKTVASYTVAAGKSAVISRLAAGTYTMTWQATDVVLIPSLGGIKVPLTSSALESGAKLSWTGHVYVNSGAPKCKLAVATPSVGVSLGPAKITIPSINVGVPAPSIPGLSPTRTVAPPKTGGSGGTGATTPAGNPLKVTTSVPAMVVPGGTGGATTGLLPEGSGSIIAGNNLGSLTPLTSATSASSGGKAGAPATQNSTGKAKSVDLASSTTPVGSGQVPLVLAIIAILALGSVAGAYARIYLIRKDPPA